MKKKFLSVMLLGAMCVGFVACDGEDIDKEALKQEILDELRGDLAEDNKNGSNGGTTMPTYTVTISVNNEDMGTVTGAGIYQAGDTAILTATPNDGYLFMCWNNSVTTNPCVIKVTSDTILSVIFIEKEDIEMVKVAPAQGEPFYIGKYEVTQKEWFAVMGTIPASNLGGYNYPIENVSYDEVLEFIAKLNGETNAGYRLPTVKEWETAAYAANHQLYTYSGTNDTEKLGDYAWWKYNSQDVYNEHQTHEVGKKLPNALGIYDMSGNVSEMTSDISADETKIITKGGSCRSVAAQCAIAAKDSFPKIDNVRGIRCGFRLVKDVQ